MQNNTHVSKDTFCFPHNVFHCLAGKRLPRCCRVMNVKFSFFLLNIWPFSWCVLWLTGCCLPKKEKEIKMWVPYRAVKRKETKKTKKNNSWINDIFTYISSLYWQNEWGWKVLSTPSLYYDVRILYFNLHVRFYVCMFVGFFASLFFYKVKFTVSRPRTKPMSTSQPKGKLPKSSPSLPQRSACHPLPNEHRLFSKLN